MNDKIAMFFTHAEVLDVLTILEAAQFEVESEIKHYEADGYATMEQTSRGLTDLIHRFNLATSGLTNEPDKV
tara:strand:+ start:621 stop:836 length:216 start_codon:yes stop_codon:yes gene_type:complete